MDFMTEVKDSFKEEKERLKDLLASGSIEDYNHYRQIVGSIGGIEWCQERLTNTYNMRMEADD
tara:strand:+ start:558 stop:746 length:189 start_codon:yes stop_codon:yes gene_type:complete